ncbi:MAG TPA: glycosyltransferase family 39 protein [Fibrella sp.]
MLTTSSRYYPWLLGVLIVTSLALRLFHVDRYGIFFDEKSTLLISQGICLEGSNQKNVFANVRYTSAGDTIYTLRAFTPAEFWAPKTVADFIEANIRGDIGNSPTYYAVLWAWLNVFGLSDLSLRLPSVLFSVLLVVLLYAFVRRHVKLATPEQTEKLALLAAALATFEPFFIAHSQVARNYSFTFLLTLTATYLFLSILERTQPGSDQVRSLSHGRAEKPTLWLIAGYGLLFVLSVLSHYLAVTVFLCHAVYAVLTLRQPRAWLQLGITGVLGMGLLSLWFIYGGGAYTFKTLAYQAALYRNYALTSPTNNPFGLILPATLPNILTRAMPVFSDLFMFTNGLASTVQGVRNTLLSLGLGALATVLLHLYYSTTTPPQWVKVGFAVLLLAGLPFYTIVPGRFLVLSAMLPLLYLMAVGMLALPKQATPHRAILFLLLSFLPTLFLLVMAWRSGHTNGITQRYSGFSFPYLIILISLGFYQIPRLGWWFKAPLLGVLALQAYFVAQLLGLIYAGEEAKYTQFGKPRQRNPYWTIAQALKAGYQPGDTIVYPNKNKMAVTNKMDQSFIQESVLDAQMVNVYLPRNATYVQKINSNEHDKVYLVKATGQRQLIYDLDGLRY